MIYAILGAGFAAAAVFAFIVRAREHRQDLAGLREQQSLEMAAQMDRVHERHDRELLLQRESFARQAEELSRLHQQLRAVESERSGIEAQLRAAGDRQQLVEHAQKKLEETIAVASKQALDSNSAHVLQLTEQVLARAHEASRADLDKRSQAVEQLVKPVQESLL
ncbi:MAG TPA: hypothetical protein VH083_12715, partial [Myxococcales bacterium]|nr:hypothetical protein [Myxococcales bacterium]